MKEAIEFSYKLYTLKHLKKIDENSTDLILNERILTNFFLNKLSEFKISSYVYAAHWGIFHEPILPERNNSTYSPITTIMEDIRAKLYPWILNKKYDLISTRLYNLIQF